MSGTFGGLRTGVYVNAKTKGSKSGGGSGSKAGGGGGDAAASGASKRAPEAEPESAPEPEAPPEAGILFYPELEAESEQLGESSVDRALKRDR